MKIALLISSMQSGGAERVMSVIANYAVQKDCDIHLLVISGTDSFYPLDARIKVHFLELGKPSKGVLDSLKNNLNIISTLYKKIREIRPDKILSFMGTVNVQSIVISKLTGIPVIVSERLNPLKLQEAGIWNRFVHFFYPKSERVVVQTEKGAAYFSTFIPAEKIKVIANPVNSAFLEIPTPVRTQSKVILAIGRLDHQKAHEILIRAFALLEDTSYVLYVVGEGPLRDYLQDLIDELALTDRVILKGKKKDVIAELDAAEIFVLPSRYEGFPNVLIEAMARQLPCISTDCDTGPAEIIQHGHDGLLVQTENVSAMADAIRSLINNKTLSNELAANARLKAALYSEEHIMNDWMSLFRKHPVHSIS